MNNQHTTHEPGHGIRLRLFGAAVAISAGVGALIVAIVLLRGVLT